MTPLPDNTRWLALQRIPALYRGMAWCRRQEMNYWLRRDNYAPFESQHHGAIAAGHETRSEQV